MSRQSRAMAPVLTPESTIMQTASEAFAALRAEIEAVPADALVSLNLNVAAAARRGLAVAERIEPILPLLAKLPDLDFRRVETMATHALAVLHTEELATEGGQRGATPLAVLLEEATPLRELLLSSAEALVLVGLASHSRVAAIRSGRGHVGVARGLQALGRLYRELWNDAQDKVPVTFAMVERAATLSIALNEALGVRDIDDDPLANPTNPQHRRAQAFTLFSRAYDECRRGVGYLRWHHDDADRVAPSLYSGRAGQPQARMSNVGAHIDASSTAETVADVHIGG